MSNAFQNYCVTRGTNVFFLFPIEWGNNGDDKAKKTNNCHSTESEQKKKEEEKENGLPLKCFGQQTNSTPENNEIPQGKSIAKLRICIPRSWHAAAPVWFHLTNGQHRDALWIWSNKQPSGTSKASDWNGPSACRAIKNKQQQMNVYGIGIFI